MLPNTAFIGLSHLGLVTSICWAKLNPKVIAIDINKNLIGKLQNGILEITEGEQKLEEPKLKELFDKNKINYLPTSDFSKIAVANLVFFTKDTPTDGVGSQKELIQLLRKAIPHFRQNVVIVLISQVEIGTCRKIIKLIKTHRPGLKFDFYHWVDTIIMTNAVNRFLKPERIIIGKDNTKDPNIIIKKCVAFFKCPVFYMSYESAEITKAFINLYLANTITYANTLADFCETFGANINDIIPALKSDKRIGPLAYLRPTLSIAGGHLERDINMLDKIALRAKMKSPLIKTIISLNNKRYMWIKDKISSLPKSKNNKLKICLWGLSYKKDSPSTKNASSLKIIHFLKSRYEITAYDPKAIVPNYILGYKRFSDPYKAAENADCIIILTDWDEFKDINFIKLNSLIRKHNIIDAVGALAGLGRKLARFNYQCIGVGSVQTD